eukprot:2444486-Rhodomonas_salina.1
MLQEEKSSVLLSLHLSGACAGKHAKPQAAPMKCWMKKCKNKGCSAGIHGAALQQVQGVLLHLTPPS